VWLASPERGRASPSLEEAAPSVLFSRGKGSESSMSARGCFGCTQRGFLQHPRREAIATGHPAFAAPFDESKLLGPAAGVSLRRLKAGSRTAVLTRAHGIVSAYRIGRARRGRRMHSAPPPTAGHGELSRTQLREICPAFGHDEYVLSTNSSCAIACGAPAHPSCSFATPAGVSAHDAASLLLRAGCSRRSRRCRRYCFPPKQKLGRRLADVSRVPLPSKSRSPAKCRAECSSSQSDTQPDDRPTLARSDASATINAW